MDITWYGRDAGGGAYRWDISTVSADSSSLCSFKRLESTKHPDDLLPDTLKVTGFGNPYYYITVDFNAMKNNGGMTFFDPPTSEPRGSETSITSQTVYFDYILFGAEII